MSVTDRCDFRCIYCMSEKMTFLPKKDLLTLEEIYRVASIFISLGVEKIRYENIPILCNKFKIKKNLINPIYIS